MGGGTLLVRGSGIQNVDMVLNLVLFHQEEKETWGIFHDMFKIV